MLDNLCAGFLFQEHLSVLLQLSRVDEAVAFARKYAEDFGSPFAYAAILMFLLKAALQAGTLDDHLRSEIIVMQEKMASFDAQHPLVRISKAYQVSETSALKMVGIGHW